MKMGRGWPRTNADFWFVSDRFAAFLCFLGFCGFVPLREADFSARPNRFAAETCPQPGPNDFATWLTRPRLPAAKLPLTFLAYSSCGATPGLGNGPAAGGGELAFGADALQRLACYPTRFVR